MTAAAAEEATYGYRRVYQQLREKGVEIGREGVRHLMGELGLQPPPPSKKKRQKHNVVAEPDWPEGRWLQIDATRLTFDGRVAWVYLVEDMNTRQGLAASVAPKLRQYRTAETLLEGHHHLTALGLIESRVVQSDGGLEFTSGYFSASVMTSVRGYAAGLRKSAVWAPWSDSIAPSSTILFFAMKSIRSPNSKR